MPKPLAPRQAFINAIEKNNLNLVVELVESKQVKPSGYHNIAIEKAVEHAHPEIEEYLLKQENVSFKWWLIKDAISNRHLKVLKVLLNSETNNDVLENLQENILKKTFSYEKRFMKEDLKEDFLDIIQIFSKKSVFKKIFKSDFPAEYSKFILKNKITEF